MTTAMRRLVPVAAAAFALAIGAVLFGVATTSRGAASRKKPNHPPRCMVYAPGSRFVVTFVYQGYVKFGDITNPTCRFIYKRSNEIWWPIAKDNKGNPHIHLSKDQCTLTLVFQTHARDVNRPSSGDITISIDDGGTVSLDPITVEPDPAANPCP
jgi:hypothetical protein